MLIPPDYRHVIRQAQSLRKSFVMVRMLLRSIVHYRSLRLVLMTHIQKKMCKTKAATLQQKQQAEKDRQKKEEGGVKEGGGSNPLDRKPAGPGKYLEDYFLATFSRWQKEMELFESNATKW